VAQILHSSAVVFPPLASVYSAFGSLVTPTRLDLVRSSLSRLSRLDWNLIHSLFVDLEAEGRRALTEAGCRTEDITFRYAADMRYLGQQFETTVELPERPAIEGGSKALREHFEREYRRRYKLIQDKVEIELVTWRVTASVPGRAGPLLGFMQDKTPVSSHATRPVHLWRDDHEVPVVARSSLRPGDRLEGPAIIEEAETTIVIPPGWQAGLGVMDAITATRNSQPGDTR
jgi:N-methylhydantoinase A